MNKEIEKHGFWPPKPYWTKSEINKEAELFENIINTSKLQVEKIVSNITSIILRRLNTRKNRIRRHLNYMKKIGEETTEEYNRTKRDLKFVRSQIKKQKKVEEKDKLIMSKKDDRTGF